MTSLPDFEYTCPSADWREEDGKVIATWVVKGTHTGAPYSPMPGVPTVEKKEVPVACANDPEKMTFEFVDGKISKLGALSPSPDSQSTPALVLTCWLHGCLAQSSTPYPAARAFLARSASTCKWAATLPSCRRLRRWPFARRAAVAGPRAGTARVAGC